MSHDIRFAEYFVVVRDDDQEIVASTKTLEWAEAVRDAAERDTGEAHRCLPATQELAENFTDWAWRTETIERDGIPTELAVIDR
ncbi:hypothetical protein L2Y96_12590 [Luteibacter aegosomaticola]|uniref:hypothetical protein n=1 Tax=Luteibacter aegosomaticola TaxID=2911538 RepID=UPI001FF96962|nr:hypothetical protein [Luteibacter aegosomaticola]UPG88257.1 hypothetical protein L2Y96_12590 [Luteibacter aegosomaticola]